MGRIEIEAIGLGILMMVVNSGCRTATQLADVPRVDLELEGSGNRGYLQGLPPSSSGWKSTRQMVQTDVEIPSLYKPRPSSAPPLGLEDASSSSFEAWNAPTLSEAQGLSGASDTYVVQKGDSLWSIAAKPEVYGKASQWQRIFEANRDILKSPDHLRSGMTLKMPRDSQGAQVNTAERNPPDAYTK